MPEKQNVKTWSQNSESQMMHESKGFSTSVYYIVISFVGWNAETLPYFLVATVALKNASVSNRNLAIGKCWKFQVGLALLSRKFVATLFCLNS